MTPHEISYQVWKNSRAMFEQYAYDYELPPPFVQLIKIHGKMFDNDWEYWRPSRKHNRKGRLDIVKRRPLWLRGHRLPTEKYRKKELCIKPLF